RAQAAPPGVRVDPARLLRPRPACARTLAPALPRVSPDALRGSRRTPVRARLGVVLLMVVALVSCEAVPAGEVGAPAPAYQAATMDGAVASLDSLRGRTVLLNVWATWCHPCREELPVLQQLHETYEARGLTIVGVSIDAVGAGAAIEEFAREYGVTYTLWHDPDN